MTCRKQKCERIGKTFVHQANDDKEKENGKVKGEPLKQMIAAVSVGIYNGEAVLDLDYAEDSTAETDLNVIMTEKGGYVEIQGTAEGEAFSGEELTAMLAHAQKAIGELSELQKAALAS